MIWLWYLLALLPFAAIAWIVWTYRKRTAARAAASSERYARIFEPVAERSGASEPAAAALTKTPEVAPTPRAAGSYARRPQLLTVEQAALRDWLKTRLPGHEILSNVSLAAVIEVCDLPEGRAREQRVRALAQQSVDCVVCDRSLEIVAVVDLESGSLADTRFKGECLKAAGVPYLRWNPLETLRDDELSAVIRGI